MRLLAAAAAAAAAAAVAAAAAAAVAAAAAAAAEHIYHQAHVKNLERQNTIGKRANKLIITHVATAFNW